uniref:tRNA intron endonuclease n=1 Tax=uncultured marine thaumarchaeote SAT1000_06_F08 TaxID=1456362 RepID=A0A075I236_9ARCH|nr:tRNA intron endonuclease [uncultured marine thaumarchaeote SAT1000_06_F08]
MKGEIIENRIIVWDIQESRDLFRNGYFGKPIGIPKPNPDEINVPLIFRSNGGMLFARNFKN